MDSASPPPFQAIADVALARLMEARAAWLAFCGATTTDQHFAAVDRINAALAVESDNDPSD